MSRRTRHLAILAVCGWQKAAVSIPVSAPVPATVAADVPSKRCIRINRRGMFALGCLAYLAYYVLLHRNDGAIYTVRPVDVAAIFAAFGAWSGLMVSWLPLPGQDKNWDVCWGIIGLVVAIADFAVLVVVIGWIARWLNGTWPQI